MIRSNRLEYLGDKFKGMKPLEFAEYHERNPECPDAHEYITAYASKKFVSRVLEIIERIELIK